MASKSVAGGPREPVHHAVSAEPGLHLDESVGVGDDLADDRGVAAERVGAHRGEKAPGIALFADGDELAFVGDVERIEAEKLAGREHIRLERDRALGKPHADARLLRDFVERRARARRASGRAGSEWQGTAATISATRP